MVHHHITDFTNAYANGPHIAGGERWPGVWEAAAAGFRAALPPDRQQLGLAYGPHPRQRLDLFHPDGPARGLVVFVHGGYWLRLTGAALSHLAAGPLAHGYAVAMPTYRLCPEVHIRDITGDIGAALTHAAGLVAGPIHLTGHSAGGQLATRMVTTTTPLAAEFAGRIRHVVSLSGVHDLRPLLATAMNADLKLDRAEALAESPALLEPRPGTRLTCWVGGAERSEFRRQNALLANIWTGLGAATAVVERPDEHHFTVVDALADPSSALVATLLSG